MEEKEEVVLELDISGAEDSIADVLSGLEDIKSLAGEIGKQKLCKWRLVRLSAPAALFLFMKRRINYEKHSI